ncbi:MAG: hypothetical protein M3354_08775 [Chloroflexota bacterium]|nr:hypothetical protein [Chloroflexota bacterium]
MAAVFALLFLVAATGFFVSVGLYLLRRSHGKGAANGLLPVVGLLGLVLAYLVAKVIYEEVIPCVFMNSRYCDFSSTQYWNLFGWEF